MDEQLYLLAVGLSLDEKVRTAIATFRHYEPEALKADSEFGYYVCDSFGKDSCVIRHLAKVSGVRHKCHHSLTTIDPPELIWYGRKYHPDTIIHKPEIPLLVKMLDKSCGPPTRRMRWCCELYKEGTGQEFVRVFGIRAAESARRKASWKIWHPWKKRKASQHSGWVLNPILYWTDEDVWRYIHRENIPYCKLYDEGATRIGCIGCPLHEQARVKAFVRWPRYEKAWKRAFEKFWNKWHGVPRNDGRQRWFDDKGLQTWQDLWRWWMREEPSKPDEDDCQMRLF